MRLAGSAIIVSTALWVGRASSATEPAQTLTFSGTLRTVAGDPIGGPVAVTFSFKQSAAQVCSVDVAGVMPDPATGAFHALVPLQGCPATMFDGTDLSVDVTVRLQTSRWPLNGTLAMSGQPLTPTPYVKHAEQTGTPECPPGYERVPSPDGTSYIVCQLGHDEVVRVGSGSTAFWIDRYEDSIWSDRRGEQGTYGATEDNYPSTFPRNGAYTAPLYAVSHKAAYASKFVSWPRALAACEAAGKRLMTVDEFFEAARGTYDPGRSDGVSGVNEGRCVTYTNYDLILAGDLGGCVSAWGAQDLIGMNYDPTNEWFAGIGSGTESFATWPTDFAFDSTYNIVSESGVRTYPHVYQRGHPNMVFRGGAAFSAEGTGIFAVTWASLAYLHGAIIARCVIPR